MPIFNDMTNKEAAKVLNDYSTVNRNASLPYINEAIMQLSKLLTKLIISKRKMPNTRQGLELMKRSFQRMPTQKSKSFGMSGRKLPM